LKQTAIDLPAIQNIPQENSYNPRLGNIKVKSVIKNIIDYIYLLITNGKTLTHIYIDIFCSYTSVRNQLCYRRQKSKCLQMAEVRFVKMLYNNIP